uniref:Uncharacterized protein n=1 Tax=Leersia perrieri TaxID=77586 RepID=A0A0D9WM73_9ORYZ
MDEKQIEEVGIKLRMVSDLLTDTEKLVAQNKTYIRVLLQDIADDRCPLTADELDGEIRGLREDREAVIRALQQVEELLGAVQAILVPTHDSASN